jgi:hypothetical protein
MIRRIGILLVSLIVLTGLSALPASAHQWVHRDQRGDGFTGGDIVRLKATNRTATVSVRVQFADLIRRNIKYSFLVIDTQRHDGTDYILYTRWTSNGYRNKLIRAIPFSDGSVTTIACPQLDVDWKLSLERIVLHVPQSCLSRPTELVRVGYYSQSRTDYDWAPGRYASYGRWIGLN